MPKPKELWISEKLRRERVRNQFSRKKNNIKKQFAATHAEFCAFCASPENLTIDHIIPIFKGGLNELDNLQYLCRPCHNKKSHKEQTEKPERKRVVFVETKRKVYKAGKEIFVKVKLRER